MQAREVEDEYHQVLSEFYQPTCTYKPMIPKQAFFLQLAGGRGQQGRRTK